MALRFLLPAVLLLLALGFLALMVDLRSPSPGSAGPEATAPASLNPGPDLPDEDDVRGLYLTARALARLLREGELEGFLERMARAGLNALVINVKNMHGEVTYPTEVPLAAQIGARAALLELRPLVAELRARGIYTIARQVVFHDPKLAHHLGNPLGPWVPPSDPRAVEYNLAIAHEVAELGFDELQFDYLRWPDDGPIGPGQAHAYAYEARYRAIEGFLKLARARLGGKIKLSVDVFGRALWEWNEQRIDPIGQDLSALARWVDFISPMVYPSHYEPLRRVQPYRTVKEALESGLRRGLRLRPFLQAFALELPPEMGLVDYIRAELRALGELGLQTYLFWDPDADYEALFEVLLERR